MATICRTDTRDAVGKPSLLARLGRAYVQWTERRRQRRDLLRLTDRDLKDIGLSRADVEREVTKWPWEA